MRELSFTSCMIEIIDALSSTDRTPSENILEPRATTLGVRLTLQAWTFLKHIHLVQLLCEVSFAGARVSWFQESRLGAPIQDASITNRNVRLYEASLSYRILYNELNFTKQNVWPFKKYKIILDSQRNMK